MFYAAISLPHTRQSSSNANAGEAFVILQLPWFLKNLFNYLKIHAAIELSSFFCFIVSDG